MVAIDCNDSHMWIELNIQGSEALEITSEGLGEMFEGDFAETCRGRGRAEGLVCANPVTRTTISVNGNFLFFFLPPKCTKINEHITSI